MRYINICHDKIIQYDIIMAFINYFTLNLTIAVTYQTVEFHLRTKNISYCLLLPTYTTVKLYRYPSFSIANLVFIYGSGKHT